MFYNSIYRKHEYMFCKNCKIGEGIFVYSFHSACGIIKKNVEMGDMKWMEKE